MAIKVILIIDTTADSFNDVARRVVMQQHIEVALAKLVLTDPFQNVARIINEHSVEESIIKMYKPMLHSLAHFMDDIKTTSIQEPMHHYGAKCLERSSADKNSFEVCSCKNAQRIFYRYGINRWL